MTVTYSVFIDAASIALGTTVLLAVQATVPAADLDYTYAGAARVGLTHIAWDKWPTNYAYTAADFDITVDAGALEIEVDLEDDDSACAVAFAADLSVPAEAVVGAALCTGLARLSGTDARIVGPWTN